MHTVWKPGRKANAHAEMFHDKVLSFSGTPLISWGFSPQLEPKPKNPGPRYEKPAEKSTLLMILVAKV